MSCVILSEGPSASVLTISKFSVWYVVVETVVVVPLTVKLAAVSVPDIDISEGNVVLFKVPDMFAASIFVKPEPSPVIDCVWSTVQDVPLYNNTFPEAGDKWPNIPVNAPVEVVAPVPPLVIGTVPPVISWPLIVK